MRTIVEVAKRAGVSIATVSNVIHGTKRVSREVTLRVESAIRELDYYPNQLARSLKVKQTRMLGMILPNITNPHFCHVVRGAGDVTYDRGYILITANTNEQIERERRVITMLRSYRVDGILLASSPSNDMRRIQSAIGLGLPVIFIDRWAFGNWVGVELFNEEYSVQLSRETGARAAALLMDRIEDRKMGAVTIS